MYAEQPRNWSLAIWDWMAQVQFVAACCCALQNEKCPYFSDCSPHGRPKNNRELMVIALKTNYTETVTVSRIITAAPFLRYY